MTTDETIRRALADAMSEPDVQAMVAESAAAGMVLAVVKTLIDSGETPAAALQYGSYVILRGAYGRRFVRDHFGISERTERAWSRRVGDIAETLGDEPSAEVQALAFKAGIAWLRRRREGADE